jgi:hypothetical protein
VRCFGHIHLSDGIGAFRVDRLPRDRERVSAPIRANGRGPRPPERITASPARLSPASILERGLGELQRAEARLPHVSRGYFVMRWKSHLLPPSGPEREHLVQHMLDAGVAEEFEVTGPDGRIVVALRSRETDGNIAQPGA